MNNPALSFTSRKMRMSDPGLPSTVSRAAIELDHASRGETVEWEAMPLFVKFLTESLEQPIVSGGHATAWLDVNTVDVVGHALVQCEGQDSVKSVEDIYEHAQKIVSEMESASTAKTGSGYERLRSFCVAFGNSLLAHRASMEPEGPFNPYRR